MSCKVIVRFLGVVLRLHGTRLSIQKIINIETWSLYLLSPLYGRISAKRLMLGLYGSTSAKRRMLVLQYV